MYLFYTYLWINYLWLYTGKAGWKGFELFIDTLCTAPFYIGYHIVIISKSKSNKWLLYISITGLILCIVHIAAVLQI